MTFAQHSVAGEDIARTENTADTDGIVPPAPKRLKRKTMEAIERATRIGGLGRSAKAALAALARTANNENPGARIFKHRETLCAETGMSPATWYRAQKELLSLGLITVDVQVRKRYGRFAGAYIYLTARAAELLGLAEPSPLEKSAQDRPAPQQLTSQVERVVDTPVDAYTVHSVASPSLKKRVPFTDERIPGSSQKRQPGKLPSDLERLRTLGLDDFFIFWLMRQARNRGHFLSHVVDATWTALKKAASPRAYLMTLLGTPTDFTSLSRQRNAEAAAKTQAAQEEKEVRRILISCARQAFADSSGNEFEVESDGCSVIARRAGTSLPSRIVGKGLAEFVKRVRDGDVRPLAANSRPCTPVTAPILGGTRSVASLDAIATLRGLLRTGRAGHVAAG